MRTWPPNVHISLHSLIEKRKQCFLKIITDFGVSRSLQFRSKSWRLVDYSFLLREWALTLQFSHHYTMKTIFSQNHCWFLGGIPISQKNKKNTVFVHNWDLIIRTVFWHFAKNRGILLRKSLTKFHDFLQSVKKQSE